MSWQKSHRTTVGHLPVEEKCGRAEEMGEVGTHVSHGDHDDSVELGSVEVEGVDELIS